MPETNSLRRLLARSVDYAGLFPPCGLALDAALSNQAAYVNSPESWMLSAFVLPIAKFAEARPHFAHFDRNRPLRVSALGPAKNSKTEFLAECKGVAAALRSLEASCHGVVRIEQLEMALPKEGADGSLFAETAKVLGGFAIPAFWEAPATSAAQTIDQIATANQDTKGSHWGFKLRTGGVQADAFPPANEIAMALSQAACLKVPIKFTAGLHHPIRQFREEVGAKMHGFLNVFGAGVLAAEHRLTPEQLLPILESESIEEFKFSDEAFTWGDWTIGASAIERHRGLITSFGSCSFDEPREDLREHALL